MGKKQHKLEYPMSTVEQVLTMRTDEMIDACTEFLCSVFPHTQEDPKVFILDNDAFVYAVGESPITIVAHVDTVRDHYIKLDKQGNPETKSWRKPDTNPIVLLKNRNVIRNVNGVLGADDRAGVFGCLEVVRMCKAAGLPLPSVILTNGEESGGIGVAEFVSTGAFSRHDGGRTRLFVEMDRCNSVDWVTYGGTLADEVVRYVESFGFKKSHGSYSDISDLQDEYLIPAVNLSIGYYSQHSSSETLHVDEMYMTINRVFNMIKDPIDKLYPATEKSWKGYSGYTNMRGYYDEFDSIEDYYTHRYSKDDKKDTTKGNAGSGKENESKTAFPQSRPGKVTIDDILDTLTQGGFCLSCGHLWSDCNCGEMLADILKYMEPGDINLLIANYLQEDDEMFVLLTTYMEMQKDMAIDAEIVEGESSPFHVGKEGEAIEVKETEEVTNNNGGA